MRQKLTEAVNLSINDHIAMGQTRAQVLSDWKGLADGEASRATRYSRRYWRAAG